MYEKIWEKVLEMKKLCERGEITSKIKSKNLRDKEREKAGKMFVRGNQIWEIEEETSEWRKESSNERKRKLSKGKSPLREERKYKTLERKGRVWPKN